MTYVHTYTSPTPPLPLQNPEKGQHPPKLCGGCFSFSFSFPAYASPPPPLHTGQEGAAYSFLVPLSSLLIRVYSFQPNRKIDFGFFGPPSFVQGYTTRGSKGKKKGKCTCSSGNLSMQPHGNPPLRPTQIIQATKAP